MFNKRNFSGIGFMTLAAKEIHLIKKTAGSYVTSFSGLLFSDFSIPFSCISSGIQEVINHKAGSV
ncbi:MAG: hypothetical protein ACM31E_09190 [Fibrobacterota bacterium]